MDIVWPPQNRKDQHSIEKLHVKSEDKSTHIQTFFRRGSTVPNIAIGFGPGTPCDCHVLKLRVPKLLGKKCGENFFRNN